LENHIKISALLAISMSHFVAHASPEQSNKFEVSPVVIDSKNGAGSTVGVEYKIKGDLVQRSLDSKDDAGLKPNATIGSINVSYAANGTITAASERNPKNFLEFQLDAKYLRSGAEAGTVLGGFFAKYETNQSFDKKQYVFGLGGAYGKYSAFRTNDFIGISANYGRIDPKDDPERKRLLGGSKLDTFYRWDYEALYMIPIASENVKSFELNYRFFRENRAPVAIRNASLERHHLATVRIGLKNDFFVAYSAGKLPFDRKNDQLFQVGLSYKF
jgi:hypothetical protein